ncbi:fimbria/pilus outer membrane usher protein [Shigella flexneri]
MAHANGVTLGQPLNETVVLVKAPGAKMKSLKTRRRTDALARAVRRARLMPLNIGKIALDTNTLAITLYLDNAVANVVPPAGRLREQKFKRALG